MIPPSARTGGRALRGRRYSRPHSWPRGCGKTACGSALIGHRRRRRQGMSLRDARQCSADRSQLNFVEAFRTDMTSLPELGDADLERRVRWDLRFHFKEYGATIRANSLDALPEFGGHVALGNLEFQFAKNERDQEFRVAVAPCDGHGVWELFQVVLAASPGQGATTRTVPVSYNDDPAALSYIGLTALAAVLKPRFERLNRALASENYPITHPRMVQIERTVHLK
jgi:hypothetical protein